MRKTLLHDLTAAAHTHPLGTLIVIAAAVAFLFIVGRGLSRRTPQVAGVERGGARVTLAVLAAFVVGTLYVTSRMHQAKPARAVVTHVVTRQVIRPGRPVLTGGEVTAIVIVVLVVALVVILNRRRGSSE